MKKFFTTFFIILIVAFAVFSFFRYFYLLKINYSLELKLQDINDRIVDLEVTKNNLKEILANKKQEYMQLSMEKQTLKGKLKDTELQLGEKNAELDVVKEHLTEAKVNFENLNQEYVGLKKEIGQLEQTKDTLKLRFSSMAELKKTYSDFKKTFHEARIELIKAKDRKGLVEGNKGYLVWEGNLTSFRKVKIEVVPALEE